MPAWVLEVAPLQQDLLAVVVQILGQRVRWVLECPESLGERSTVLGVEEDCSNTVQLGIANLRAEDMSQYSMAEGGSPEEEPLA